MLVAFILDFPSNNAWNGVWTGQGRLYAKVVSFTSKLDKEQAEKILEKKYFRYFFGDGWMVSVNAYPTTSSEARKLGKRSEGFCGYDWMVDSIIKNLDIRLAP